MQTLASSSLVASLVEEDPKIESRISAEAPPEGLSELKYLGWNDKAFRVPTQERTRNRLDNRI
jgi:hypothetical protein